MELVFQESNLEYLSRILCDTVTQEQTADLIVPDSCPDCERVVDAFGTVLIRSAECSAGSASVSGTVRAGVLFVTQDGLVEPIEAQIPFSVRRDFPAENADCTLQCCCTLRSVDARMLNSRKILVRVSISCTLTVYRRQMHTCYDIAQPAPTLQLKRVSLPLRMPLALGEKSFPLNEELELPQGKALIARLLKGVARAQLSEQKVVGSKGVFKGTLFVHILYSDRDDALHMYEWQLPFSQYVELDAEREDSELRTLLCFSSMELEPDGSIDAGRVFLSANLLAQCTALGRQEISLIADAYCTDATLSPRWDEWEAGGMLDSQRFSETAVARSEQQAERIVDAWYYPDEAVSRREGDGVRVELPISCNILYTDAQGELQGMTLRPSVTAETAISENGECAAADFSSEELFCSAGADGVELRIPVSFSVESYAAHRLRGVSGGEVEPLDEEMRRPAVILRRIDAEEDVWEIAKQLRAPVEAVMQANDLTDGVAPANSMLLIPM